MSLQRPGNSMNLVAPAIADMVVNSAYCYISRLGSVIGKTFTVTGTPNGVQTVNLFTLEGGVEVLRFYGVVVDVTDVSAVTAASLDLYDGMNTVPITSAAGTDLSACSLGSLVGRTDQAAVALDYLNADQVRIVDGAVGIDLFAPIIANAKNGVTNYFRFHYTSDGGGAEFQMTFEIIWRPLIRDSGLIEVVA